MKSAPDTGTWRRKKGKIKDEHCRVGEKNSPATRIMEKNGDAGIGRPFNIEHDLHVSPDLSDLPPAWMSALKSQGLSESDLLLIAAAQQRQRQNTHPLSPPHQDKYDDFFRTPFSAPAGKLEEPFGHGYAIDSQSSRASSTGVLKQFPFEIGPGPSSPLPLTPTTPTALGKVRHINHTSLKDHPVSSEFESKGPASNFPSMAESHSRNLNRTRTRSGTDSYPVSASESDIESSPLPHSPLPHPHSHYEPLLPTPSSPSKRLSAQLRGFKGLRIGINEDEEEWGKIILFAIMDSERETAGSEKFFFAIPLSISRERSCLRSLEPVGEATVRVAYKGLVPRPGSHLWLGQNHEHGAGVRPRTPSPMKQLINSNTHSSPLPSPSPYRPQNRPENGSHIESLSHHSALIHADVREEGRGHGHGYDD
ncbi:hypothetical protein C368_00603 [Cryptococcus neoformans 125.91]|nr:hypothetical protein C368_00603 [Cryptococcus neoformans var. grubii 125.91]